MEGSWEGRICKTSLGPVESVCFCHHMCHLLFFFFFFFVLDKLEDKKGGNKIFVNLRDVCFFALGQNKGHLRH